MKPDTLLKELRDSSRMKKFNLKTQDLRANFVFSRIALPCVRKNDELIARNDFDAKKSLRKDLQICDIEKPNILWS